MSFQNFANGKMSGISKIVHLNILTFSVIIITIRGLPAVALTGYSEAQARILNKYYFRACSSAGESTTLIKWGSVVRVHPGPPFFVRLWRTSQGAAQEVEEGPS